MDITIHPKQSNLAKEEALPSFNQFKASNYGRPTKYHEEMPRKLFNYYFKPRIIEKVELNRLNQNSIRTVQRFPTLEGFLVEQCIGVTAFRSWLKKYPDFKATYEMCKNRAKDVLVQNILEEKWKFRSANLIAVNYTDIKNIADSSDNEDYVEIVPPRRKGYDISQIDKYCSPAVREKIYASD